jgi:hypothetical protein
VATELTAEGVAALEQRRLDALLSKDLTVLSGLTSDDLSYTHTNSLVEDKAAHIDSIRTGFYDYQAIRRFDTNVCVTSDVAVLTGRQEVDLIARGRPRSLNVRYTAVWLLDPERPQLLCWHSTLIPAPSN